MNYEYMQYVAIAKPISLLLVLFNYDNFLHLYNIFKNNNFMFITHIKYYNITKQHNSLIRYFHFC